MEQTFQIAHFALNKTFDDLPSHASNQLKKHLLDSIASLVHAASRPTIQKLAKTIKDLSGDCGTCSVPVIGLVPFDRAAQYYTALIRYPDFMDNFLGKEATCHPSDNIGALLAASQLTNATGKDFLTAMAIGYEIECRLVEEVPVMVKGFDHTLLLAYSLTAALSKMLYLNNVQTAHALSIAGCSYNPLVTCRASYTYEWKGLMSSFVALGCVNSVLMAKEGMTGPVSIFEGPKGIKQIFDMELQYDWNKDNFELIRKCILKGYNSEVHTQTLIEAALDLKRQYQFQATDVESIEVTTFLTCYDIVGGGEYGDRKTVHSKEQADHSLPYVLSAALLDDQLYPAQLLPERINQPDVQTLLQKVNVHTKVPFHKPVKVAGLLDPYTEAYPDKVPGKVTITLKDGRTLTQEKEDYHGFFTRPFTWTEIEQKFEKLTGDIISKPLQQQITNVIGTLENHSMKDLVQLLNQIPAVK